MTRRRRLKITRSMVLLTAGLVGIGMETLYSLRFHQQPDATLVLVFSAMIGLPVYLHQDSRRENDSARPGSDTGSPPVDRPAPTPRPKHDDA